MDRLVGRHRAALPSVGRVLESAAVRTLLGSLQGRQPLQVPEQPTAIILRGPSGVGKTHLLNVGIQEAVAHDGITLLRAAGNPNEAVLGYAALADLFEDLKLDAMTIPDPQRDALDIVLYRRNQPNRTEPLLLNAATRTVLSALCENEPVLIAIDDFQWLDRPTSNALLFALRRLQASGRPLGLLATWRSGEGDTDILDSFLADLGAQRVEVEPMNDADITSIVMNERPDLGRETVEKITAQAAGFPLFASELARHNSEFSPEQDSQSSVGMPASIDASFGRRLRLLSQRASQTIGLLALSAEPTTAMLDRSLGPENALRAMDELVEADLVVRAGASVQFRHPLVARSVLGRLSAAQATELRKVLVDSVSTQSERAHHLRFLYAAPHADTGEALASAAQEQLLRGDPRSAALLAELAVDYTPLESTSREELVATALRLMVDGLLIDQAEALQTRVGALRDPRCAGWAMWARGMVQVLRGRPDLADLHFGEVLSLTNDPEVVSRTLADHTYVLVFLGRGGDAAKTASAAVIAATAVPNGMRSEVLAVEVMAHAMLGMAWSREQLAESLRLEDFTYRTQPYLRASGVAATIAVFEDNHPLAESYLLHLVERGAATGPSGDHNWTSLFLAYTRFRMGTLQSNEGLSVEWDVFSWVGSQLDGIARLVNGTDSLGSLGAVVKSASEKSPVAATLVIAMLAGLVIAEGRHEELVSLAPLFWGVKAMGPLEPVIMIWGADLAESYVALGQPTLAEELVNGLREIANGVDRRSVSAAIARAEATRFEYLGDFVTAAEFATQSVDGFAALLWPLELGRSLLVRAQIHYRCRRRRLAHDDVARAVTLFEGLGSRPWLTVAESTEHRYGSSRHAGDVRTGTDRTGTDRTGTDRTGTQDIVAVLVRQGLSNAEIGSRLHMSVKTVESHLTEIYRKAGVKSRGSFQAMGPRG